MASNKLLPSYILACVLFLFIYQAAGYFEPQWHHKNSRDPRHLRGPPSNCFRRPNCGINFAGGIVLDQINVFEVEGRSDAIFQIDIGKNFTALNVAFEADHEDVTASIVLTKVFPPRQEGGLRTSYDNRSTSWQIRISDEIIRSHCDETAFIRIDNRHRFKAVVKLTLSFELPPEGKYAMIIALSATGGAIVLVVLAFAIICYLRKKRRRMIQVDFPILSSGSQPQTNTVHAVNAPNSFQQIDAQQRRLIQQQLILQQQLLLLQQQHLQLRESHQFSNPHSPSGDFNHQLHQHQHQHQERDEGQQHQDMTVEKLDVRFPETFYEYIDTPLSQTICSICLEEMRTRTVCRQLDCNHVFHSECIKLWLVNKIVKSQSISCPNCNRGICDAPPETAVTKNNELHDSHVVLMIPDNAFE